MNVAQTEVKMWVSREWATGTNRTVSSSPSKMPKGARMVAEL